MDYYQEAERIYQSKKVRKIISKAQDMVTDEDSATALYYALDRIENDMCLADKYSQEDEDKIMEILYEMVDAALT